MTNILTYGGPAVHKTERYNPTEILVRLIKDNPKKSREAIERLWLAEVEDDPEYRTPALKYYFFNAWTGLHPNRPPRRAAKSEAAQINASVAHVVEKLKRAIIISELIQPNGKKIADCTGTEMGKFGKFGIAVSGIVKRRKVGAVLTEEQLYKLWIKNR